MNKHSIIEKELFDMVYQWGRVGIVTDENCNAFQDKIKEFKMRIERDVINEISDDNGWEETREFYMKKFNIYGH